MILQKFIEANDFKITGGSEYGWNCFGPDARYMDCDEEDHFSISAVFDSKTQQVYAIEAWDYNNGREYRWIDSVYKDEYEQEAQYKDLDPNESLDGHRYIDLEVFEDMLEKIKGIRSGEDYDTRVQVPINLPDDELFRVMQMAHERDITLNQFVEEILWTAIRAERARQSDDDKDGWDEIAEDHWDDDGNEMPKFPAMMTAKKKKKKGKK